MPYTYKKVDGFMASYDSRNKLVAKIKGYRGRHADNVRSVLKMERESGYDCVEVHFAPDGSKILAVVNCRDHELRQKGL